MKILETLSNYSPMKIARTMLHQADETMEEITSLTCELSEGKKCGKAFLAGVKEGFVNSATFWYLPMAGLCFYWKRRALRSEQEKS